MDVNTYYLEYCCLFYWISLTIEIDEQNHEGREIIFEEKRQEALEKKLSGKFIKIDTSNVERGYDTDYEVSKI